MKQKYIKDSWDIESAQLSSASEIVQSTIERGGVVYLVSGDMHSNAVFLPFFVPGMLCALSPMTEATLSNTVLASRAYYLRNVKNIGSFLCGYYRSLCKGDTIILADCGDSQATREILEFAKEHGIYSVHISPSPEQADVCISLNSESSIANLAVEIGNVTFQILDEAQAQMVNPDVWLPFTEENAEKNEALIEKYRPLIKKL